MFGLKQKKEETKTEGKTSGIQGRDITVITQDLLGITSQLSEFDVEMNQISEKQQADAGKMTELSESNLAIVQETTATMTQVSETMQITISRVKELQTTSENLEKSNEVSQTLLQNAMKLKENVISDSNIMSDKVQQLVELMNEIESVVKSVHDIADQTNLLALNAAIEAARAGEAGKGFAVVADEIRQLSDDTKKNLAGLNSFMEKIYEAAKEGQEGVDRAVNSTNEMGEVLDQVAQNVGENINGLNVVTDEISSMVGEIQAIGESSEQISQAMNASTEDAQSLSEVAKNVSEESLRVSTMAHKIGQIDNQISGSLEKLFGIINASSIAMTDEELLEVVQKAKASHKAWLEKVKNMADTMEIQPLQTDSRKCAFGHFYQALKIHNPILSSDWQSIEKKHHDFHDVGKKLIRAIENNDSSAAMSAYQEAENLSRGMMAILDKVEQEIRECIAKNISILP
ncbi:MAG: methyl-accepting chemotaxis protein [Lachnospiraceae bacterium]